MYIILLQEELQRHTRCYNNHKLSTMKSKTPLQIININKDKIAPQDIDDDVYGTFALDGHEDWDDGDLSGQSIVTLEPRHCPLTNGNYMLYSNIIPPISMNMPRHQLRNSFIQALGIARNILTDQNYADM